MIYQSDDVIGDAKLSKKAVTWDDWTVSCRKYLKKLSTNELIRRELIKKTELVYIQIELSKRFNKKK